METSQQVEMMTKAAATIEKMADKHAQHTKSLAEIESRLATIEQHAVKGTSTEPAGAGGFPLLKRVIEDERFAAVATKGASSTGRMTFEGISVKALLISGPAGSPATGLDIAPQRHEPLTNDPRRSLSLLSLLPSLPVQTGTFEFIRLDGYTNHAGFQSEEGAEKPETGIPTAVESVKVATIAHWLTASTQVLQDCAQLSMWLQSLLLYGLSARVEEALVAGDGTGGGILGLVPQATAFTASSGAPDADAIGEAIAHLESIGWHSSAVLMHPQDWQRIRAERSPMSYYAGGWAQPSPPSIWNVPIVLTPSMNRGEALVMDTSQAMILDRMEPSLIVGHRNDDLTKNLLTVLAEMRAGLAVFSPTALQLVTLE